MGNRHNRDEERWGGGRERSMNDRNQNNMGRDEQRGGESSYGRGQGMRGDFDMQRDEDRFGGRDQSTLRPRGYERDMYDRDFGGRDIDAGYGGSDYSSDRFGGGSSGRYRSNEGGQNFGRQQGGGQRDFGGGQNFGRQQGGGQRDFGGGQRDFGGGYGQQGRSGQDWQQGSQGYDRMNQDDWQSGGNQQSWTGGSQDNSRSGEQQSFRGKGPRGYTRSDDRIREDVCDRLADHDRIDASEIEIDVSSGEVTLRGTVEDRRIKHQAENLCASISGVSEVHNQLRVQPRQSEERTNGHGLSRTQTENRLQ